MASAKDARKIVLDEINAILKRKDPSAKPADPKERLFGGASGMDSLDLAELVVRLEGIFGTDPFGSGQSVQTIAELIAFYEREGR